MHARGQTQAMAEPPKKKRKLVKSSSSFNPKELKGLEDVERSDLVSDEQDSWQDKELWIIQLPKNVSILATYSYSSRIIWEMDNTNSFYVSPCVSLV